MEKEDKPSEKGKDFYIIRSSANLDNIELLYKNYKEYKYDDFIFNISNIIFEDLLKINNKNVDSVGIWITFEDEKIIDNAIDIETLNKIKEYGSKDVEAFKEFFKMTLEINEG